MAGWSSTIATRIMSTVSAAARVLGPAPACERQPHDHRGALADPRRRLDLAAVGGHDLAGHVTARGPGPVARCGCRSRVYASKIVRRSLAAMPAPWSRTTTSASRPSAADRRHRSYPEPGACSIALASRLRNTCSRRPASARTPDRLGLGRQPDRRRLGRTRADLDRRSDDRPQVDRRRTTSSSCPLWIRLTSRRRSMSVARRRVCDERTGRVGAASSTSPWARCRSTSWR